MKDFINAYIKQINQRYQTGVTTEHSFRGDLQQLIEACTGFKAINEPSHIECGAPDYLLERKGLVVAYIEAKDLEDGDLDGRKKNKEQFDRYKASLDTIIFTDYLDFHLYEHGEWKMSARLAEIQGNKIRLSDCDKFIALMEHLRLAQVQQITSATKLAQIMAGKARLLRDVIENALVQDGEDAHTELNGYMQSFRQTLLHDITPKVFADIYAQTIAYGMFAARIHDKSPESFSRSEASELIPKSNPFLRKVFQQIAGYDLDERIVWIVDDLVAAFAATDMEKILSGFGKNTQQTDPILHFYEDFLYQYDPAAKKQSGVYYTPQPVVEFIVRAVDDILKTEFNLPMGLADTSKVEVEHEIEQDLKHRKEKVLAHRVQVLDPATGTGTFLAETVRQIKRNLGGQLGAWNSYVPEHLLPRLHGFELMMAPYTIAHLKLDLEVGIQSSKRFGVYLTNSLEEANPDVHTLFGHHLAEEAGAASDIKKDAPVMIVMGNPPYSISSNNKGEWISKLLEDYKKNLNERKINIEDDYIKFIRLAQYYVERNGEGVLAYICNNSFIDGLIHRQMRSELMRVFDKIYILDLHGNTRKKETAPDGSKDENVFDIMQGVSINIFIKKAGKSQAPAEVRHFDLYGLREYKYEFLRTHNFGNVEWQKLNPQAPQLFFVPKDFSLQKEYEKGFKIDSLMKIGSTGIESQRDNYCICDKYDELYQHVYDLINLDVSEVRTKYEIGSDGTEWNLQAAKNDVGKEFDRIRAIQLLCQPFLKRYTYFSKHSKGFLARPRYDVMRHMLTGENISLVVPRQTAQVWRHVLVADTPTNGNYLAIGKQNGAGVQFPLYLYPEPSSIDTERRPNLDEKIWAQINTAIGKEAAPEDIFDYIYGVLHSPAYRAKYKEFLKVDFPRIPYPKDQTEFEHYRDCGHQLRELHLMHNVPESAVTFTQEGSMVVEQVRRDGDRVYINDTQYFDNVPQTAWEFYIGGYQPAQKWLKDRKGRALSYDDKDHYRQIITVLLETKRIMDSIDK